MGNTPLDSLVTSTVSSIQEEIPWSKQFTMLDKQPLNNTFILHHLPTNNSYKVKHMTLNKTQHQQIFRQIDIKKNTPSPFVTKLQKTQQYTVKGYCSEHQEVFLMYKYVETNLKQQILNRRFRQEKFLEEQIKIILQSGIKGISYLHEIGCSPKGLNTSQILLTQQRAVLINDPWLSVGSPLASTGQTMMLTNKKNSSDDQQKGSKIYSVPVQDYPSPQKILHMNQLIEDYNEWLSQLFTFGMIVLQTIFMTSLSEQLYEKSQKKIYYHRVKEKIQEIREDVEMQVGSGRQSILGEIKEDLRRLLSHEPKIRESVYLKYKRSHNSYLFLTKPKQEFKLNPIDKLLAQNSSKTIQNIHQQQANKQQANINSSNQAHKDKITSITNKMQISNNRVNGYEEQSMRRKQDWILNSVDLDRVGNVSVGKQNEQNRNRFRVVSSSVGNGNNNMNQIKDSSLLMVGNGMIQKNKNENVRYRQLGGTLNMHKHNSQQQQQHLAQHQETKPSFTIDNQLFQHQKPQYVRPNSFLQRLYSIKNTNSTNYQQSSQLNMNRANHYQHTVNTVNGNQSYNYPKPNPIIGNNTKEVVNPYSLSKFFSHKHEITTGELSPKKETLVEKQLQQTSKYFMNNNNKHHHTTATTLPSSSSPYISSISTTNPYQSQITNLFHQDYNNNNKPQYDYLSQLKLNNQTHNPLHSAESNLVSLPSHMVTRSYSSYVIQDGKIVDQNYNFNNISSHKLPQTTPQTSNWTYQSMVTNNNNQHNNTLSNHFQFAQHDKTNNYLSNYGQKEQPQNYYRQQNNFITEKQQKYGYPGKISLSQSYLMKYGQNYQISGNHLNLNSDNLVSQTQSKPGVNLSYPYSSNTFATYETVKQNFPQFSNKPTNYPSQAEKKTYTNNNNLSGIYRHQEYKQKPSISINQDSSLMAKIPSYKELNNFNFREVGSLYCEDSHFLNDKESIVIQSYSGGLNKYQPINNNKPQLPMNTLTTQNMPTISPKNSFEINHSMINNTRNEGKSFSSMDEDLKQLRKFGQQQQKQTRQKKPNSSYSSSQKVSLIDRIYDPQVMGSFERKSLENNTNRQDHFGGAYQNNQMQANQSYKRSSQNIPDRRSMDKPGHSRNNSSSQNYLQTPQRYPNKYKLNSTIREASCEDSGVNQSHNNSHSHENSYEVQKPHPNTEISKYHQHQNEERRYSERRVDNINEHQDDQVKQKGFSTDRGGNGNRQNKHTSNHLLEKQNPPTFRNLQKSQQNQNNLEDLSHQKVTLYADGSRYIGPTDDQGQSHGFGTLYYPDGLVAYEGQWQHGDFNGKGKLFNPYQLKMQKSYDYRDLTKIDEFIKESECTFNHDLKQGSGVLKMHNNEVYEGQFSEDLPHGRGKFYCSDGNVVSGRWERGYLQQTF